MFWFDFTYFLFTNIKVQRLGKTKQLSPSISGFVHILQENWHGILTKSASYRPLYRALFTYIQRSTESLT